MSEETKISEQNSNQLKEPENNMDSVFYCQKCGSICGNKQRNEIFTTLIGAGNEPELDFESDNDIYQEGQDICANCENKTNLWTDLTRLKMIEVEEFLNPDITEEQRKEMWEAFKSRDLVE